MGVTTDPVVFFGTGPVAAKSLELLAKNFKIEAVVTKPRPAHHKGSVPVLEIAQKLNLQVLTVANKSELDQLFSNQPVSSRLAVLIDFGIIVSQKVIDYFELGIVNSHFSVLPDLRGADPITFAILSGQPRTGVSLMMVVEALDEGPLVAYDYYDLPADITTPELTDALIYLSDSLLRANLPDIQSGLAKTQPQSVTKLTPSYSRRLTKADGQLDWHQPAETLARQVRAFNGWPGSFCKLSGIDLTVMQAHVVPGSGKLGDIVMNTDSLSVQTKVNRLSIDRVRPAGKTDMAIKDFLAGYSERIKA